jgi:hypothetical protein
MSDETKDPRESVLYAACVKYDSEIPSILARLDAADPIRAAWPELVEALGGCEKNLRILHNANGQEEDWDSDVKCTFEVWQGARAALTRARKIMEADDE